MRTFSSTVAPGRMLVIWYERATPCRDTRFGGSPVMSCPSNTIRPLVGRSTPVRQLKNVDLPAPLGPMTARISPRRTATETLLSAASPPNRIDRPSVLRMTGDAVPRPATAGAGVGILAATLRELAGGGHHGLVLGHDLEDLVLVPAELEQELSREGLVILLAQGLVPLREVVALLHLEALEGLDELHRVPAVPEARLLHADLEHVDALEVRLHVAVRQRPGRVDRLQARGGVLEEALVGGRVQ